MSEEVQLFNSVLCVSARRPLMHLTREQQQILSHDIQQDQVVKIVAFAGTGGSHHWSWQQSHPHCLKLFYVVKSKSTEKGNAPE